MSNVKYQYDSADIERASVGFSNPRRAHGRLTVAALATALALATVTPAALAPQASAAPERDYAALVDPFVGTEGDYGNDMPAAMAPNGLAKVNPRTAPTRNHTGYNYAANQIAGFTHTNLDGVGGSGGGGDILVVPTSGEYTSRPGTSTYERPFTKDTEIAEPGYYAAELGNIAGTDGSISTAAGTIDAEVTATIRSGLHRYSFPEGENPTLVVDLRNNNNTRISSTLEVDTLDDGRAAFGGQIVGHFYNAPYTLYYYAETDQAVTGVQTWGNSGALTDATSQAGTDNGLVLSFDAEDAAQVGLRLTLSPISVDQAKLDQRVELDGKSFDDIREQTRGDWNDKLGKVAVTASAATDPDGDLEKLFYTHMYRMFAMPMNATSTSGTYRGLDGAVHRAHGFTYYDSWATWDDFRKFSVIGAIDPALYRDMVQSKVYLFADAQASGSTAGVGSFMHSVPTVRWERSSLVIADAIAKGFTGIERLDEAYPALLRLVGGYSESDLARGYKPSRPGSSVQQGYDDWALGVIAQELGMEDEAARLYDQAAMPIDNLIKPGAWTAPDGAEVGVLTPRGANGQWESADYERFGAHSLYQGTLWQYNWYDAYDMDALIDAMGGQEATYQALRHMFGEDGADDGSGMLHSNTNEIDLQTPYLFNYVGEAHMTQKWARAIHTKETWNRYTGTGEFNPPVKEKVYKLHPRGLMLTMDNDAGTMSSTYVAAALGLYPVTTGSDEFQIGSPIFDSAVITYDTGRTFTVTAQDVSEDDFYIQSATLNGAEFGNTWLDYATLLAGGEVSFQMGDSPSTWGSESAPAYSMSTAVDAGPGDAPRVSASATEVVSDQAGAIDGDISLTLTGTAFAAVAGTSLSDAGAASVVGLPSSVTADVVVSDSHTVSVNVTGSATADSTFYVNFADSAFADGVRAADLRGQGVSVLSPLRISVAPMERAVLSELIDRASLVRKGNYSTVSFQALERALERAQGVLGQDDASSIDLRFAADNLTGAIEGLALAEGGLRRLEGEASDAWSGGELKNEANQSSGNLGGVSDGSWIRYFDMDFMGDVPGFLEIRYDTSFGSGDEPSTVEVRAGDEDGELVATVDLVGTGGWGNYTTIVAELADASALANAEAVTFVLLAPDGRNWVGNFDWFQFSIEDPASAPDPGPSAEVVVEAEDWDDNSGGDLKNENSNWSNAGAVTNVGGTHDGDWLLYQDVSFGESLMGEVSVGYVNNSSRGGFNSRIEVFFDEFDPANVGEPNVVIPLPVTGSNWSNDAVASVMLPELMTGTHDVYLRLRTDQNPDTPSYVANLDKLTFSVGSPTEVVVEAEDWEEHSGGELKNENSNWSNAGPVTNLGGTHDGDWLDYGVIDFGSGALDQVSVAYVHNSGRSGNNSRIEVYLDEFDPDNLSDPYTVIPLPNTGSNWSGDGVSTIDLPSHLRGERHVFLRLRTEAWDNHPFVANIDKLTFFVEVDEPEPDPVDMTDLANAVAEYGPLESQADRFGDIDFGVFVDELSAARSMLAAGTASQTAVDEQVRRLTLAAEQLVPAERRLLENLVSEIEEMDSAPYTQESWDRVALALGDAQAVLADDATSDSDLAAARSDLATAVDELELEPTVPHAPAYASAEVKGSSVSVTWQAPDNDGGSPITGYVVELSDGQRVRIDDPALSAVTFTWLTPGSTFTATVTAVNAVGQSPASDPVAPVQAGAAAAGQAGPTSNAPDNAALAAIDVDGVIIGGFDADVLTYVVAWPEDRSLPQVGAQTATDGAHVDIQAGVTGFELLGGAGNGMLGAARVVASGTPTMTITVESADGSTTQTYSLAFALGADVTLPSELITDGGSDGGPGNEGSDGDGADSDGTGTDSDADASGPGGSTDPSGDGLATTGANDVGTWVALAAALLLLGVGLAVNARRRSQTPLP